MISVIIPLWNKEAYIARTLESVLKQTFRDFEVIVVDDGSTDNSPQVVRSFNDDRIRLIHQSNAGVSAARNRGMTEAKYDYLAFIDADDEWEPDHLATLARLIKNYPECRIYSTCYMLQINDKAPTKPNVAYHLLPFNGQPEGVMDNYYEVATGINAPVNMSTFAVRKDLLQEIGGFPTGIPSGEDILTLARLNRTSNIAYSTLHTSIVHLIYTGKNARPILGNDPLDTMFDQLLTEAPHRKGVRKFVSFWHKQQMVRAIYQHKNRLALTHALRALRIYPKQYKVFSAALLSIYSSRTNADLYSLQQKFNKLFRIKTK